MAGAVVRLEQRVAVAIELERRHSELRAQRRVERRARLARTPVDPELDVAVIDEEVGPERAEQLLAAQMVLHVGEAETRGDPERPRSRAEHDRLRHAVGALAA